MDPRALNGMLTQLKNNPAVRQELQKLGYAGEQIPAWLAEAAPDPKAGEAAKLLAAPIPAIHISMARKTGVSSSPATGFTNFTELVYRFAETTISL
jgi:hypothetical protein